MFLLAGGQKPTYQFNAQDAYGVCKKAESLNQLSGNHSSELGPSQSFTYRKEQMLLVVKHIYCWWYCFHQL